MVLNETEKADLIGSEGTDWLVFLSYFRLIGALLNSDATFLHQHVAGWSGLILAVVSLSLRLRSRNSRFAA